MQGFEKCLLNLKPTCGISFSRQSSACAASDLLLCSMLKEIFTSKFLQMWWKKQFRCKIIHYHCIKVNCKPYHAQRTITHRRRGRGEKFVPLPTLVCKTLQLCRALSCLWHVTVKLGKFSYRKIPKINPSKYKSPKIVKQNPTLNHPSKYKPPGGLVRGICPRIQSKTKQKW